MRIIHTLLPLLLLLIPQSTRAVKAGDFKTCDKSGFCRRGRALSARAATNHTWDSPYALLKDGLSIEHNGAVLKGRVRSALYPDVRFNLEVDLLRDGMVRVRMDEVDGLRKRYDGAAGWALIREPELGNAEWTKGEKELKAVAGGRADVELRIVYDPLRIVMLVGGKEMVDINGRGLLHMEHFRLKEEKKPEETPAVEAAVEGEQQVLAAGVDTPSPKAWFEGDSEDAYWEESFGSHHDSKPKGPESLSLDITFPQAPHIYGLPEHASPLSLPTTAPPGNAYSEPYRLYNLDVFEYLADSPMALYGAIPLVHAHGVQGTVGALFLSGAETWIDVTRPEPTKKGASVGTSTHWITESGILDLFLLPGPSPSALFSQYTSLTGPSALPQYFALGYHQCRWNYISSRDVLDVQKRFDEERMPLDVTWLDIEYTEEKKYFVWDKSNFPNPAAMVDEVAKAKRKMVAIVDPHLKRTSNYHVYSQAQELDVLVKTKTGGEYEGWCWPGSSSWADFFNPQSWDWWHGLFKLGGKEGEGWTDSTADLFIWNDMNEPSVFNGPEITMPKDNIHHGGWEHRDIHNINGMLFHNQTSVAITHRTTPSKRPFVLSRSFYAGSQRYGAIWTGDNMGTWEHMKVGVPMVLSLGVAGMSFTGADVGGFFGNPEPEMLVRWYQVGMWAPFFRGHAHIDTKRREPYLLDEPYKSIVRGMLEMRYAMLTLWYTLMHEASVSGTPPVRAHYMLFPHNEPGFALDTQFYIGDSILVKPVTDAGVTQSTVYLPEAQVYYSYPDYSLYRGSASGKEITVPSPLGTVPMFYRGGSIIPLRLRPRRSSPLMAYDPFTLIVALSNKRTAKGELYLDDGESFGYQSGELVWREFRAEKTGKKGLRILSEDKIAKDPAGAVYGIDFSSSYNPNNAYAQGIEHVRVERVIVLGLSSAPKKVYVQAPSSSGRTELHFKWEKNQRTAEGGKGESDGFASVLTIKDPAVKIAGDWEISLE